MFISIQTVEDQVADNDDNEGTMSLVRHLKRKNGTKRFFK